MYPSLRVPKSNLQPHTVPPIHQLFEIRFFVVLKADKTELLNWWANLPRCVEEPNEKDFVVLNNARVALERLASGVLRHVITANPTGHMGMQFYIRKYNLAPSESPFEPDEYLDGLFGGTVLTDMPATVVTLLNGKDRADVLDLMAELLGQDLFDHERDAFAAAHAGLAAAPESAAIVSWLDDVT